MSALERPDVPVKHKRADLRPVAPPQRSHALIKGSFPLMVLALLAAGMVGHLVMQTKIQDQAFELGALQTQADRLSAQEAILHATLDKQSTPQQLAYTAAGLGMVANPYSTYLILPTGEVIGTDEVVRGNELPIISAAPQITPTSPEVVLEDTGTTDTPAEAPAETAPEAAPEAVPDNAAQDAAVPADAQADVQAVEGGILQEGIQQ